FTINREMLTSPDTQLGDSLVDGSVYYTDITLTLAADQVNPTDEWLLGIGYRDYLVTGKTSLAAVVDALELAIEGDATVSGYTVSQPTSTSLRIRKTAGFTLKGANSEGPLQQQLEDAASIKRSTLALDSSASPISFTSADITLSGSVAVGDKWTITITDGSKAGAYSYTIVSGDTINKVDDEFQYLIFGTPNPPPFDSGSTLTISGAGTFSIEVSVAGDDPQGRATISGTPSGQSGAASSTSSVEMISWTSVDIDLSGIVHKNDLWTVTIAGGSEAGTYNYTVGQDGDAVTRIAVADGLQSVITGGSSTDDIVNISGAGVFSVGFSVVKGTAGTPVSSTTSSSNAAYVVTLSGTPVSTEADKWTVSIPGATTESYTTTVSATIDTTAKIAADLAQKINNDTSGPGANYRAVAKGSVLVIIDITGATITPTFSVVASDDSAAPAARGTIVSASASRSLKVTLGGSTATNEIWQVSYGAYTASVTIGETYNYGSGNMTIDTIEEIVRTLAAKINAANNGYSSTTATDASIDTLVIARRVSPTTGYSALFAITPPDVASGAVVSGTVEETVGKVILPVNNAYNTAIHDVWIFTLTSNRGTVDEVTGTFSYTVGQDFTAQTSLKGFLAATIDDAINQIDGTSGSQNYAQASASGDTVVLDDAWEVYDFQQTRLMPYTQSGAHVAPTATRYDWVEYVLDGEASPSVGDEWVLTLNGVDILESGKSYTYKVQAGDTLTMAFVAGQIANVINAKAAYNAFADGSTVTIVDEVSNGRDTFTFGAASNSTVHVVFDIDHSTLVEYSYEFFTGQYNAYGQRILDTVDVTIAPALELLKYNTGTGRWEVISGATNWYGDGVRNESSPIDKGSETFFDPFLEYTFTDSDLGVESSAEFRIRVTSVVVYESSISFWDFSSKSPAVYPGIQYRLITSIQRHDTNLNAIELKDKVLTIVEEDGKGQVAVITSYDPETSAYTLMPLNDWTRLPDTNSRYEITSLLSKEPINESGTPLYGLQFNDAPLADSYSVVLTAKPGSGSTVIVDVVPALTRTYNADEAFNADAAFGETRDLQVHTATNQAILELLGAVNTGNGEYWIVTLGGIDEANGEVDTTLSVEALLQKVIADLADGSLEDATLVNGVFVATDYDLTGNAVFVYQVLANDTLQHVADALRDSIAANGFTVTNAGTTQSIMLRGPPVAGDTWTITLDDGVNPESTHSYTVQLHDTLAKVATELAVSISANLGLNELANFIAVAEGDTITMTSTLGQDFALAFIGDGAADIGIPLTITSDTGTAFFTGFAITPDTAGGATVEVIRDESAVFQSVGVELTGQVAAGETWTLTLSDLDGDASANVSVSYLTEFRDDLSVVAAQLTDKLLATGKYDVILRGRIITISNATVAENWDVDASVAITPDSLGRAVITPQLVFNENNWDTSQVVTVMAIDDDVVDGGDALVFPEFEERLNAIRGPLTIQGGALVGGERFLNDPFRLPEETNKRQSDGTLTSTGTNLEGHGVITDDEAFHFSGIYGERPGFDPRMNDFPFEFTFLDGPGVDTFIDVESVSKEILSISNVEPFNVDLTIDGIAPSGQIVFSGAPELTENTVITTKNPALKWHEVVVSLTGAAYQGETWKIDLNGGTSQSFSFAVTAEGRALSKVARDLAAQINDTTITGTSTIYRAEALVDILGNAKIRIWAADGTSTFKVSFDTTNAASAGIVLNGTPKQDFSDLFSTSASVTDRGWSMAAFEMVSVNTAQDWILTLNGSAVPTFTTASASIEDLTAGLEDLISTEFLPLVSGYTATFTTPWSAEDTSTFILSGTPVVGETWSIQLDIAGMIQTFDHLVLEGETLETIAASLAERINVDGVDSLLAEAHGVALVVVNSAANTDSADFLIVDAATAAIDAADATVATENSASSTLSGVPNEGETWFLQLAFENIVDAGEGTTEILTRTYLHIVTREGGVVETLEDIAHSLAEQINNDFEAVDFLALADGTSLMITSLTGRASAGSVAPTSFVVAADVAPAGFGSTISLPLNGTPVAGENWTVVLGGTDYAYTVVEGDTPDEVAAGLAALISGADGGFSASAVGSELIINIISDEIAVAGSLSFTGFLVDLSGTVQTGQTWTLIVDGLSYDATGTTLAEIAGAFAGQSDDMEADGSLLTISAATTIELR
ncbi:MAG: hypothetical protein GY809_28460, partial [Planctomycetes bacterium]|nr:hypothetical protein [Planctomycetota bacterium]